MDEYKLAAFDMDGTLLNSEKRVSENTKQAIRAAIDAGKYIVIATGRAVSECEDCAEDLEPIRFSVCESGAVVYDRHAKRILYRTGFKKELADVILDIGTQFDTMPYVLSLGEAVAEKGSLEHLDYYHMSVYRGMMSRVCVLTKNLPAKFHSTGRGIEKINFYCASAEVREEVRRHLEPLSEDITVAFAEETSIEISPKGLTKAAGLSWLCGRLGIRPQEVIAAGDADNDRDMLAFAGLSAAMGNAPERIRRECGIVVRDNDHDGCCDVIRCLMEEIPSKNPGKKILKKRKKAVDNGKTP
ncbi:MAG: Cof-type HAD-IIB family hydrolase [Lachnospiraceae bacterium]|nr:Cof-type HAD-IIB family hydrolase [Lachnospiraceae bacterium]MCI1328251.1 Cof-type HAD-IIB family hydrolase [Lachnospiraceae bacterium]